MSYQSEREAFLVRMTQEGMDLATARKILRHANTVQRLSAAECNGDYPCDNGERKVDFCPKCESGYVPSSIKGGLCPNCRAAQTIRLLCEAQGCKADHGPCADQPRFVAITQGDPRGACVKIQVPSGFTDDWGREGVCVPTRNY